MNKQDRKYLKRLLETPSPTGCEQRIAAMVRERMEGVADQVTTDVMGSDPCSPCGQGLRARRSCWPPTWTRSA